MPISTRAEQAEQHPGQHGDDRVVARRRLRLEGAVDEADREAEVLVRADRGRLEVERALAGVSVELAHGSVEPSDALVARDVAVQAGVHAVGEVHVGRDGAERLRPSGAVDVPVELLVRVQPVGEGAHDVLAAGTR